MKGERGINTEVLRFLSMDFNKLIQNDVILDQYLKTILSIYFTDVNFDNPRHYHIRCNVCGDSKKSKYKKRGYILKDKQPWIYYCHNCGYKKPVTLWMKEYFPLEYKQYIKDILQPTKKRIVNKNTITKTTINYDELKDIRFFVPILKGSGQLFELAIKQCEQRLIPKDVWLKWYIATGGRFKNRLIIPFYDCKERIYYYQGRHIFETLMPKYLSREGYGLNSVYNYYLVDENKPVSILEGPIDSLYIENAVGMTGLKLDLKELNKFKNRYFILDGDKSGNERAIQLLERNEYVFCWKKYIHDIVLPSREKWDINDVIIYTNRTTKFTYDELKPYLTNSILDKALFV